MNSTPRRAKSNHQIVTDNSRVLHLSDHSSEFCFLTFSGSCQDEFSVVSKLSSISFAIPFALPHCDVNVSISKSVSVLPRTLLKPTKPKQATAGFGIIKTCKPKNRLGISIKNHEIAMRTTAALDSVFVCFCKISYFAETSFINETIWMLNMRPYSSKISWCEFHTGQIHIFRFCEATRNHLKFNENKMKR